MKNITANKITFFLALSIFLLAGINAQAATTRVVTKLADTNDGVCNADCSLREAVAVAINGDTVAVKPGLSGTISLQHGMIQITKSIIIDGSDDIVVSGSNLGRVFLIKGGATVIMKNLEIKNGSVMGLSDPVYGDMGAGIYVTGSTLYLNESNVHHNQAFLGAGILATNGSFLKVTNSQIASNKASRTGGISCSSSTMEINSSTITLNEASYDGAGGVFASSCDLTMTNTTVSQNKTDSSNTNPQYGGGIKLEGENNTYKIINSSIINNLAAFGGGISNNKGKLYLINSTVSGNSAYWHGGGIYTNATTIIRNSTITLNYGLLSGSGIRAYDNSDVYLSNTIVGDNTNAANGSPDIKGTVKSLGHNIIGSTAGATVVPFGAGDKLNTDPMLAPLFYNGGQTPTHLPQTGSPAINGGENSLAVDANAQPLIHDQRGYARVSGGTVDIGSVEVVISRVATVSVSGKVINSSGRPLNKALVTLTGADRAESITVETNHRGEFHFDEVETGSTYVVSVSYKRYEFQPQAINVNEEINDLLFVAGNVRF